MMHFFSKTEKSVVLDFLYDIWWSSAKKVGHAIATPRRRADAQSPTLRQVRTRTYRGEGMIENNRGREFKILYFLQPAQVI